MLEVIFTTLLQSLRGTARLFGYEIALVLSEHKIKTKFKSPNSKTNAWDSEMYVHGNIFFKDLANPIKPTKSDISPEENDIITSERYKTFMEQSLIDDMLKVSQKSDLTLKQVAIGIGAFNMLLVGLVYYMTVGGI